MPGLSACVFAFDAAGRVLLVQSKDRADTWEPPGGVAEAGEDPAAAAARECLEETGLTPALVACSGAYFNAAGRLCLAFLGTAAGDPVPSDETPRVAWFPAAEAGRRITRPNLRLRWEDACACRSGSGCAGYAVYDTRPYALRRRLAAGPLPPGCGAPPPAP